LFGLLLLASLRTDVYADYGIAALPLLHVSAGILVAKASAQFPARGLAVAGAMVILFAGILPSTISHLVDGTRFDYRPAISHIRRTNAVAPVLGWPELVIRQYGAGLNHLPFRVTGRDLDRVLEGAPEFWLILSAREYGFTQVADDTEEWIGTHCLRSGAWHQMRTDSRQYRVELFSCRRGDEYLTP
jgi:hypothetical protein